MTVEARSGTVTVAEIFIGRDAVDFQARSHSDLFSSSRSSKRPSAGLWRLSGQGSGRPPGPHSGAPLPPAPVSPDRENPSRKERSAGDGRTPMRNQRQVSDRKSRGAYPV